MAKRKAQMKTAQQINAPQCGESELRRIQERGERLRDLAASDAATRGEQGGHTPGALDAARVLMNGREFIQTEFGKKRLEGVASLIDNETHAPELLRVLQNCLCYMEADSDDVQERKDVYQVLAAIAAATGKGGQ